MSEEREIYVIKGRRLGFYTPRRSWSHDIADARLYSKHHYAMSSLARIKAIDTIDILSYVMRPKY